MKSLCLAIGAMSLLALFVLDGSAGQEAMARCEERLSAATCHHALNR